VQLTTSPHLETFRAEVRAFIAENAPGRKTHAGVRAPEAELIPAIRAWTAALYSAGYLGITWPEEHGGRPEADAAEPFIVAEELVRARTWEPVGAGSLAASALIEFGTPEQRSRFLPRLRNGEDIWCQLFSEPGAGSDLAALQTRAVRTGDEFVVDGQKVWTTNGQHADIGYLLARTDPGASKHRGITAFAIDMRTPGIDIRPLREITGTTDFNEVFLEGVRVPADRVIGQVDDGWRVAMSSLGHERAGVAASGVELFLVLQDLVELAAETTRRGESALHDTAVRQGIGRLAARVATNDVMAKLVQSRMLAGKEEPADAPGAKIFFSETNLAMAEFGMDLQGVDGVLVEGDPAVRSGGWWQDAFLYARAYTISGGSNEVMRNVIAERALGLPRDPV
jgi:alkylation response protein AidB-like acyl-CoA dehydrogenase